MINAKIYNGSKLLPDLCDKEKYVVHIRALDQTLKHGLVLKKVHRVISFQQSAWLKVYIDKNTELRKKATKAKNDSEKNFFELINNNILGKTMEYKKKHKDMRLVTDETRYKELVIKPNFKYGRKFSEKLMCIEMGKRKVKMTKPVYLGQAILDLSKIVMYKFHYNYMLLKYGGNCLQLCYMDTDLLMYHIKTEDFYKDIACDVKKRFGTSNYSKKTIDY